MLNPHEKISALSHLQKAWEAVNELPTTTPCQACQMHRSDGVCLLYIEGGQIPKDVLPAGCEKFVFNPDSMPF